MPSSSMVCVKVPREIRAVSTGTGEGLNIQASPPPISSVAAVPTTHFACFISIPCLEDADQVQLIDAAPNDQRSGDARGQHHGAGQGISATVHHQRNAEFLGADEIEDERRE